MIKALGPWKIKGQSPSDPAIVVSLLDFFFPQGLKPDCSGRGLRPNSSEQSGRVSAVVFEMCSFLNVTRHVIEHIALYWVLS